ncbi:DNA primase family protein [Vagococcus salmoninarum]|uniref:DNA primase family protein n=1 Tax=Vagococcus salmoninarum TaxID=2739 RepID=UPI003F988EBE
MKEVNENIVDFIQKAKPVLEKKQKDKPSWLSTNEKGEEKVVTQKLAYAIMERVPIIRVSSFSQGARFDKATGTWRMDNLSEYLDSVITDELEGVGKWSQRTLAEVKRFIMIRSYDRESKSNPFDSSKPYLISFKNGTYNFKTQQLQPHNPKDYIFQSHNFELDINEEHLPTKTLSWLDDLTGDNTSARYLIEMMGYCFYRSYAPFQSITILIGAGGNGKSAFLNYLTELLNDENVANASLSDLGNKNNRFATSMLYQKLANVFADIESDFIDSTGLLKALTGGDKLMAEYKGQDPFNFENFAKLIFSANSLPQFSNFSLGFDRRLYVVPFNVVIDEAFKQKHDLKAIEKEIPQFAYYCLKAFNEAMKRGKLSLSEPMLRAKEEWLKESNHLSRFIEDYCKIDETAKTGDTTRNVFEKYRDFCFDENIKSLSQPKFNRQLENLGIIKKTIRQDNTRVARYLKLFLKSDYD